MRHGGVTIGAVRDGNRLCQRHVTRERHLPNTEQHSSQGAEQEANRREDVSKRLYSEGVVARQQQPVVLSVVVTSEGRHVVATFDLHHGILNRNSRGVKHLTFDPWRHRQEAAAGDCRALTPCQNRSDGQVLTQVDLPDEGQQSLPVGRPERGQLASGGKLTAGNFQRQLQTLSPHVVVVLHPACNQHHRRRPSGSRDHLVTPCTAEPWLLPYLAGGTTGIRW